MSESNIENSRGGSLLLLFISLIVGGISVFSISHFQKQKSKIYHWSKDAAPVVKGLIEDFNISPIEPGSPECNIICARAWGEIFFTEKNALWSQYDSAKGIGAMVLFRSRRTDTEEWSGLPIQIYSSNDCDPESNKWKIFDPLEFEIPYVANPYPDDENFELNERLLSQKAGGSYDSYFKPWKWEGTYALYDLPDGPHELKTHESFQPLHDFPGVENVRFASSRKYTVSVSFESKSYSVGNFQGRLKGPGKSRDKFKVYVKVYYRKLDPLPQSDGFPRYTSPEIFSRIVEVDVRIPNNGVFSQTLSIMSVPGALEWGEEFVKGEARGAYLLWSHSDKGKWEYSPLLGFIPFAKRVTTVEFHEKELTLAEVFPDE